MDGVRAGQGRVRGRVAVHGAWNDGLLLEGADLFGQYAKGHHTARERLEMLLDPGSFVELDALTRHRSTNSHDSDRPTRPARATWLKPWRRRHRAMRGPTSGGSVEMEDSLGRHDGVRACRRVAGWDGSGGRGRGVLAVLLSPAE